MCPSYRNDPFRYICIYGCCMFLTVNSVNQLNFVMVKCGVLFEVRTEFLYRLIIYMSFGYKGLKVRLEGIR
jgi:hypothetical protein